MKGRWLCWILLPLLVLALGLELRLAERRWRASRIVNAVERITVQASQAGRVSPPLLERNLMLLRRAAALDPVLVDVPIARGAQYLLLERPHGAIRAYREALRLEPRAEVYANLGRAYQMAGQQQRAREAFRTAVRLHRRWARELRPYLPELQRGKK